MKIKNKVVKILNNYNLQVNIPDEYSSVYEYKNVHPLIVNEEFSHPELNDFILYDKYKNNIPDGWYGFSIGEPTPKNWWIVIDKIINLCIVNDPKFVIKQIKMKYGGIRFYVESEVIEDISEIESLIMKTLYDKKLIY